MYSKGIFMLLCNTCIFWVLSQSHAYIIVSSVRFYFKNWHGTTEGETPVWRYCLSKLRGGLSPQKAPEGTPLLDAASLDYLFAQVCASLRLFTQKKSSITLSCWWLSMCCHVFQAFSLLPIWIIYLRRPAKKISSNQKQFKIFVYLLSSFQVPFESTFCFESSNNSSVHS